MRANERKTYTINQNTKNNRFFSENQTPANSFNQNYIKQSKFNDLNLGFLKNFNDNSRTNSVKESITSTKSLVKRISEDAEEQSFESFSKYNNIYNKNYLHFNKINKENALKQFNKIDSNNNKDFLYKATNQDNKLVIDAFSVKSKFFYK